MKKKNNFLTPMAEENKSQVFIGDLNVKASSADNRRRNDVIESEEYVEAYRQMAERVMPAIDLRDPSTWAVYGSAEKYYENAFSYVYSSYPYDGSALEKIRWSLSASAIDLAVMQHIYPLATGFVGVSSAGWGTQDAADGRYGLSNTPEYIKFSGGPYVGSVFSPTTSRESSLKVNGNPGNTVEFWLKKDAFVNDALTTTEVIFDSHTADFDEGNASYGRFLIELDDASGSPFFVTYMSGTVGADRQQIGDGVTAASVADGEWHHYAIAAHHTGSKLAVELYIDGAHNSTVDIAAGAFGAVTGYFNASIGSLRSKKDGIGGLGYGNLSGSIDEFRFWKERRTSEEIGNYFDFPVNGATDTEEINSVLGVYYKFNEGTLDDSTKDKVILDYSGRLNNGEFIGYNSTTRFTGSAVTLSTVSAQTEIGDPIINPSNSRVKTASNDLITLGRIYDSNNHRSLFKTVPQWAYDGEEGAGNLNSSFAILLQTIAERFDSIRMLIDGIPKIGFAQYKDFIYAQGSVDYSDNFYNILGCQKDFSFTFNSIHGEENFAVQNLLGRGFTVEDSPITDKAVLNEYFYNLKFDHVDPKSALSQPLIHSKAESVKAKILNSVYANLSNIYKTKGTMHSFRNLIRCFGVDENLVAPNVYAQNIEKEIKNEPVTTVTEIKSLCLTGSNNSTVLHQARDTSEERNYIEGVDAGTWTSYPAGFTIEAKVLFPHVLDPTDSAVTTSIFGMNQVSDANLTVPADNWAGIKVKAEKSALGQSSAKFTLSSDKSIFTTLTSSYFSEVYANTPWHIAVRFSEETGSPLFTTDDRADGAKNYKVDFIGHQYDLDVQIAKFQVSGSIARADYGKFLSGNKSVFLGANRTDIVGSLVNITDAKFLYLNVWDDFLEDEEIVEHAKSLENIGRARPLFNKKDNQGDSNLAGDSLALSWQFDNVSDDIAGGKSSILDLSSGSAQHVAHYGPAVGYKYPATTHGIQDQVDHVHQEFLGNVKYIPIDNLYSRSKIEIKDREVDTFQLDSRPVTYMHSFEKSMYQAISKEMMNFLAGAAAFNTIIGEPVYKYRQEYKSLEKLRERFFARVENEIDLERFIEYYKWIDSSLGKMLQQLQPATSAMNLGMQDVVESHALERNKYKHHAPQLNYKDPKNLEARVIARPERGYSWARGHHPISDSQEDNCLWWSSRAESTAEALLLPSAITAEREVLRIIANSERDGNTDAERNFTRPYNISAEISNTLTLGGNGRTNNEPGSLSTIVNAGFRFELAASEINREQVCNDVATPADNEDRPYTARFDSFGATNYTDGHAHFVLPFTLISSSTGTDFSVFKPQMRVTNNHHDYYGTLQGPFTYENAGGMPHRRVRFGTDSQERPEAYTITATATTLTVGEFTGSKSHVARGIGLQTPYSFSNIKTNTTTGPYFVGNYDKDYQVVLTAGRSSNNRYLTESGSILVTPAVGFVAGTIDYAAPVRGRSEHVITNQFSSPGGPETQGVYGRDRDSGEFSLYNTMNYRNLSVRQPLDILSTERSEQFGYRSGTTTQGSIHKTNRNFMYSTASWTQASSSDNYYVQHPIPRHDFSYSWITASATNTVFDFMRNNDGFGHQHLFNTASAKAIQFLDVSPLGSYEFIMVGAVRGDSSLWEGRMWGNLGAYIDQNARETNLHSAASDMWDFNAVDFANLNTNIYEPVNEDTNTLGHSALAWTLRTGSIEVSNDYNVGNLNYINQFYVDGALFGNLAERDSNSETFGNQGERAEADGTDIHDHPIQFMGVNIALNSIILNRQGPYGWPSWKQIRGGSHPVIRAHKKSNTFSRVFLGKPTIGISSIIKSEETPSMNIGADIQERGILNAYDRAKALDERGATQYSYSRIVKNYKEVPATDRHSAARIVFHTGEQAANPAQVADAEGNIDIRLPKNFKAHEKTGSLDQQVRESNWFFNREYYDKLGLPVEKSVLFSETFQNDLTSFANMQIVEDTKYSEKDTHTYLGLVDSVLQENEDAGNKLLELNYIEKIYPREENTFTNSARKRENFEYFPWNSTRANRNRVLSGNISYTSPVLSTPIATAFPSSDTLDIADHKESFYGVYDILDAAIIASSSIQVDANESKHFSASSWPLDSRADFTAVPVNIHNSYFNLGTTHLFNTNITSSIVTQGTLGEGILQNDFSTFPLGYNGLYGTPPFSTVYSRRIPQSASSGVYLAGEAKWQAADDTLGPFYNSYDKYSEELRLVGQDHSIVPEFRMSEFVEKVLTGERSYPDVGNDFLSLTGAIYQNSNEDVSIAGTFYKTYSNSDFLKYFQLYDEEIVGDKKEPTNNLQHARINFKCKAAMKFLPYRGFYPAERSVELTRLFNRHYLSSSVVGAAILASTPAGISESDIRTYADLRANASRYQCSKPLFGPGVLYNSIKAGIAVDYPIFSGSFDSVYTNMTTSSVVTNYSGLAMPATALFTGSAINSTDDGELGIPRISGSSVERRIQFEDIMSPVNLFNVNIYDNEPHPSASLIYGSDHWHRVVERPARFGNFNTADAEQRLGVKFSNTKEALANQLAPYTLAMQNFAAETVNFFVEDGHLTTVMSKPIKEKFANGTSYKMRIRLTNVDTTMYDRHSAFGPPVDDGDGGVELIQYASAGTGSAAAAQVKFVDYAGNYDLSTQTVVNDLPRITAIDEDGKAARIFFYDTASTFQPTVGWDHITASTDSSFLHVDHNSQTTTNAYINVNGRTAAQIGSDFILAINNVYNYSGSALNPSSSFPAAWTAAGDPTTDIVTITSDYLGPHTVASLTSSHTYGDSSHGTASFEITGTVGLAQHVRDFGAHIGGVAPAASIWTTSSVTSVYEHGFMPYVPPFLDPGADPYVEVTFTPTEERAYGAQEIIESSSFEYYNFNKIPSNAATNTNYINAMSLSASLNLGLCVSLRTDNVETIAEGTGKGKSKSKFSVDQNEKLSRWAIQTKWETPVLDFTFVTASALDLTSGTVTATTGSPWKEKYWNSYYERGRGTANATIGDFLTASTGMWHQRGTTLTNASSKGYFLQIEDITGSAGAPGLAGKLGFNIENEDNAASLKRAKSYRSRVGAIENKKLVKEAIVAIPYVVREDTDNLVEFVRFDDKYYEEALANVTAIKEEIANKPLSDEIRTIEQYREFLKTTDINTRTVKSDSPVNAIEYQLFMMDDYILPPQLDFRRTTREFQSQKELKPFMMYFFQFHASFNREDLANIWQNLYPSSSASTANPRYSYTNEDILGRLRTHDDMSYVSHYLETVDLTGKSLSPVSNPRSLFSPEDKNNKTRWLIFKVKQRGMSSLEEVRKASVDPRIENIEKFEYLKAAKPSMNKETIPAGTPGLLDDGTRGLQFNWPYDYFSFVELIKLEAKIDSYNYTKDE